MWAGTLALLLLASQSTPGRAPEIRVRDEASFRDAIRRAAPGVQILLEPGTYRGPFGFSNLHGSPGRPIIIAGADPNRPPVIAGGGGGLQLSRVSHVEVRGLVVRGATGNGLNIDDGGVLDRPSHHVTLRKLRVMDIGSGGNHDGIKLSGVDDFVVQDCTVERWGSGGSAVDMVGCHRGRIVGSRFREGGDNAIQAKGGSSQITVEACRFVDYGQRGVNAGGSTGLMFFRPPLASFPPDARYEARDIRVQDCVFVGGMAPIAFVGVDGAIVRRNTLYRPGRWALRILQETREPGFVPSRNGVFEENIVVFRSDAWSEGGVNVGPGTAPQTFRFARNFWFCEDRPDRSRPSLPTPETDGAYGRDPLFVNPAAGDFRLKPGSPAARAGARQATDRRPRQP